MATEQLGVGPTADADLVRLVDMYPAFSATFPIGTGAWTSYTPTLDQAGAVTKTVDYAKYMQIGRMVVVEIFLTVTGTGTGANAVQVGLPITAASSLGLIVGSFNVYDNSASQIITGASVLTSTNTVAGFTGGGPVTNNLMGTVGFTAGLASSDVVRVFLTYEAATGGNPTASPTAAWIDYTPVLAQGVTTNIAKTINSARYTQIGRMVAGEVYLTVTGTGTATSDLTVTLPVTALAASNPVGAGFVYDASVPLLSGGTVVPLTTTTMALYLAGGNGGVAGGSAPMAAALANGDQIRFQFCYEAAAGGGIPPVTYAWDTYTPTWTQSATITKTVTEARYTQVGKTVTVKVNLVATGAGTAANAMIVSLPVTAAASGGYIGSGAFQDASVGTYGIVVTLATATTVAFLSGGGPNSNFMGGTGGLFTAAVASPDNLWFTVTYEAA